MSIKKILRALLDLILPRSPELKTLETIGPTELREKVPAAQSGGRDFIALFDYKHPLIRQAIWELKYRGNRTVTTLLAACLFETLADELTDRKTFAHFTEPLLIPIPLSAARLSARGWNQCELLADTLHTMDHGNFFTVDKNLLIKTRDTESQTKKNRAERLSNLADCFAVKTPEKIAGRNIILVDDVTTTGATFAEAERTLLEAGARKILSIAIAH